MKKYTSLSIMILILLCFSCKKEKAVHPFLSENAADSEQGTISVLSLTASSQLERDQHAKKYAPGNLFDGRLDTVWAEGAKGDGIGEWIHLEAAYGTLIDTIVLYPGFFKKGLFEKNARPRRIRLSVGFSEKELSLEDTMEKVVVPLKPAVPLTQMKVMVLDVYRGSSWKDLCISEVEFYYRGKKCAVTYRQKEEAREVPVVPEINLTKEFTLVKVDVLVPRVSSPSYTINSRIRYSLPLNIGSVQNREIFTYFPEAIRGKASSLIRKNGFVVIRYPHGADMNIYDWLGNTPNFITTDSLLHGYHVQFMHLLKNIEEREFYQDIYTISAVLANHFHKMRQRAGKAMRDPMSLSAAFFYTCAKIINPSLSVPSDISRDVQEEGEKIQRAGATMASSLFKYQIPYSLFKPRGHYTRSEQLKRYFKVMNYMGNASFAFKQLPGMNRKDRVSQATASLLIYHAMLEQKKVLALWERLYSVISFLVGESDDYTIYDLDKAVKKTVPGYRFDRPLSGDEIDDLGDALLEIRKPRIYSGTGNLENLQQPSGTLEKVLENSIGFRFMGARLVPDTEIMQRLITPSVGKYLGSGTPFTLQRTPLPDGKRVRGYAMGLDIMAVFGSETAKEILKANGETDFNKYNEEFTALKEQFSSRDFKRWYRTVYGGWLYSLFPLMQLREGPTFMTTEAWRRKSLNTTLASWAELRHDTILYVKQPFAAEMGGEPEALEAKGYVEPVPDFYLRMRSLVDLTRSGLLQFNLLARTERSVLERFSGELKQFQDIAIKELENRELSRAEYDFIQNYTLSYLHPQWEFTDDKDTRMIADVMTNGMDRLCVEEGVGYVNMLYAAYKLPSGKIMLGRGPVFSYHEFKQDMNNRLTDEQWKVILQEKPYRGIPRWTDAFAISSQ